MKLQETELTPELAAQLLANPHSKQRRPARQTVEAYTRAIKEGRWRLVADPILVSPDGQMFNGVHRCSAAIAAHRSIPVLISWDADPDTFDLIDIGRKRSAYQFITEAEASMRASAARVTMWYERRFDRQLGPRHIGFDLHEILAEVERRESSFDAMTPSARAIYDWTRLPTSVSLGAFSIAFDMGYQSEVQTFVDGVVNPFELAAGNPSRLLADRFRKQEHKVRRRVMVEDWTLLVRALNLSLEGKEVSRLSLSQFWPRVAESEGEYNRRRHSLQERGRSAIERVQTQTRKADVA